MNSKLRLKIPGKVVINGSYIVLRGETGTSVTIDRYLEVDSFYEKSDECSVVVNIKDRESLVCHYRNKLECDSSNHHTYYIFKIVEAFYNLTGIVPSNRLIIRMTFDRDFFINQSVKTGIGSSACIISGIIFSLLFFNEDAYILNLPEIKFMDSPFLEVSEHLELNKSLPLRPEASSTLIKLYYTINKMLNSMSSGIDVISCLLGCIKFSSKIIRRINNLGKYLILGTFGNCTSTRSVINNVNIHDKKWDKVIELNSNILKYQTKEAFKEYLDNLFTLNSFTVPDEQYEILKETFRFDIYGCGISGAGGEDAVWCIVNDHHEVYNYWKSCFKYVIVTLIVDNGLTVVEARRDE